MQDCRDVISKALEMRSKVGIKVRQPLSSIASQHSFPKEIQEIIKDEVNVKKVIFARHPNRLKDREGEERWIKNIGISIGGDNSVKISTFLDVINLLKAWWKKETYIQPVFVALNQFQTSDLMLEGTSREFIRAIQEGRKKAGFKIEDRIYLGMIGNDDLFKKYLDTIVNETLATLWITGKHVEDPEYQDSLLIDGENFSFSMKRR